MLEYLLRGFALAGGLVLLYLAVFLYENEQGKIQNVLEDLWLRIEERQYSALSHNTALLRMSAQLITRLLDSLFGKSLFSLQSIGVSICFSFASLYLFSMWLPRVNRILNLIWAFLSLGWGLLPRLRPAYFKRDFVLKGWFALAICFYFLIRATLYTHSPLMVIAYASGLVYFGLALGVICDILFIALARKLLRWMAQQMSNLRLTIVLIVNVFAGLILILPILLIILEYRRAFPGYPELTWYSLVIRTAVTSNLFILVVAITFVVLTLTMLVHRLFWPSLSRPIYSLQRLGIARRGKLLGTVGGLLVMTAVGGLAWLDKIIERLSPF
jgi:hypothetical protein